MIRLIKADTVDTAAAVVPEYHAHMLCRILRNTPAQEICQRGYIRHASFRFAVDLLQVIILHNKALDLFGIHNVIIPAVRTAGLYYEAHLITGTRIQHLLQITGCHAVFRFQIRAAEIYKDGPGAVLTHALIAERTSCDRHLTGRTAYLQFGRSPFQITYRACRTAAFRAVSVLGGYFSAVPFPGHKRIIVFPAAPQKTGTHT